jgi:hypothetical protein
MLRATRQRAAILALLDRADRFRSARAIHDELCGDGHGIGLTTVYRTLQSLAAGGIVDVLRSPSGEAMYRRCGTEEHHHHLGVPALRGGRGDPRSSGRGVGEGGRRPPRVLRAQPDARSVRAVQAVLSMVRLPGVTVSVPLLAGTSGSSECPE